VRLARNTIPPPPSAPAAGGAGTVRFLQWIERTFAVGTHVRFKAEHGAVVQDTMGDWVTLPPGTVGVVRSVDTRYGMRAITVDATVSTPLFTSASTQQVRAVVGFGEAAKNLEPLDDNWGPLVVSSKPTYRLPKRRQTTSSRGLLPNTIPPPPLVPGSTLASRSYGSWVSRTYQPGTHVAFPNGMETLAGRLPDGARGVVEAVTVDWGSRRNDVDVLLVHVRIVDARDASGLVLPQFVGHLANIDTLYFAAAGADMMVAVKPLDDNWAPFQTKRWPVAKPRKTTSRRTHANPIPPPPAVGTRHFETWIKRTFLPGTAAKWTRDSLPYSALRVLRVEEESQRVVFHIVVPLTDQHGITLHPGHRAAIERIEFPLTYRQVEAQYRSGELVVLDDHWAPLQPKKRYSPAKPRKTTSRRTRPNRRTSKRRTSRKKGRMGR
jgi:hypothetical protein